VKTDWPAWIRREPAEAEHDQEIEAYFHLEGQRAAWSIATSSSPHCIITIVQQ